MQIISHENVTGEWPDLIAIRAEDISVAQCHLDDDRDIALSGAWRLLSVDEVTRAQRFQFDRDRIRYVRGRGFLRTLLGKACGLAPGDLVFGTGPQGKPFLQDSPLAFNLSHSRDLAVLALAQSGSLGIDIEFVDRQADISGLAETCLTQAERAVLDALPKAAQAARFFAFWTAKEARMKMTGEGMLLAPRQIALDLQNGVPVGYLRPDTPAAQAIFLDLGHPAALCCLALPEGAKPTITSLTMERACHVAS